MVQKAKCFTLRAIFHFLPCCLTAVGYLQVPGRTLDHKVPRIVDISQVCACLLHVIHVSLFPAGQDCLIRDQPGPAVLAGSCKVQTLHQTCGIALATRGGWDRPTNEPCSKATPQHAAHTCMTLAHGTCLSCWRLCMAACHRIMHGQGSNLVGAWSPPVQHSLLLCPC